MVPEMIKMLERSSLEKKSKSKRVWGTLLGTMKKVTSCPQENSELKHK